MFNQTLIRTEQLCPILSKAFSEGKGNTIENMDTAFNMFQEIKMLCEQKANIQFVHKDHCQICQRRGLISYPLFQLECQCEKNKKYFHEVCFLEKGTASNCRGCKTKFDSINSRKSGKCRVCRQAILLNDQKNSIRLICDCNEHFMHDWCFFSSWSPSAMISETFTCDQCDQVIASWSVPNIEIEVDCNLCSKRFEKKQVMFFSCDKILCRDCISSSSLYVDILQNKNVTCGSDDCQLLNFYDFLRFFELFKEEYGFETFDCHAIERFSSQTTSCSGISIKPSVNENENDNGNDVGRNSDSNESDRLQKSVQILKQEKMVEVCMNRLTMKKEPFLKFLKENSLENCLCNHILEYDVSSTSRIVRCPECRFSYCRICKFPHFTLTCDAFRELKDRYKQDITYSVPATFLETVLVNLQLKPKTFSNVLGNSLIIGSSVKINSLMLNVKDLYERDRIQEIGRWNSDYYFSVSSFEELRLIILHGLQPDIIQEFLNSRSVRTNKLISFPTVQLYNSPEAALEKCNLIVVPATQQIYRIVLSLKVNPAEIFSPDTNDFVYLIRNPAEAFPSSIAFQLF